VHLLKHIIPPPKKNCLKIDRMRILANSLQRYSRSCAMPGLRDQRIRPFKRLNNGQWRKPILRDEETETQEKYKDGKNKEGRQARQTLEAAATHSRTH
jgi:hypothetical protein